MKIKFDIEATPQELRTFFGLPDIEPLQKEMIEKIRSQMATGAAGFDPMTMLKPFLPENLRSLETMQRAFWENLLDTSGKTKSEER